MYRSNYRNYKPHPNKVNPNITNTVGREFRVYINSPNTWIGNVNYSDISNNIVNSTSASNSRPPLTPVTGGGSLYRRGRITASPNPIRHWRKQLQPEQGKTSRNVGVGQAMDRPSGSNVLTNSGSNCDPLLCQRDLTIYIPKNYVRPLDTMNCWSTESNIYNPTIIKKVICDPESKARERSRYASTNLSKKYYTTGKAYLKSRVKLLDQNQTLSKIHNNSYSINPNMPVASNNYIPPSNSITSGSQLYNSNNSPEDNINNCNQIIYKPSNYIFAQQGAVSSSSQIARLKYNAIIKNNYLLENIKDENLLGSTPQLYRGDIKAPYFIKSKYQSVKTCISNKKNSMSSFYPGSRMPSGGSGIRTVCFTSNN